LDVEQFVFLVKDHAALFTAFFGLADAEVYMALEQIALYLLAALRALDADAALEKSVLLLHALVLAFQLSAPVLDPVQGAREVLVSLHDLVALEGVLVLADGVDQRFLHLFAVFELVLQLLDLLLHMLLLFLQFILTLHEQCLVGHLFFQTLVLVAQII